MPPKKTRKTKKVKKVEKKILAPEDIDLHIEGGIDFITSQHKGECGTDTIQNILFFADGFRDKFAALAQRIIADGRAKQLFEKSDSLNAFLRTELETRDAFLVNMFKLGMRRFVLIRLQDMGWTKARIKKVFGIDDLQSECAWMPGKTQARPLRRRGSINTAAGIELGGLIAQKHGQNPDDFMEKGIYESTAKQFFETTMVGSKYIKENFSVKERTNVGSVIKNDGLTAIWISASKIVDDIEEKAVEEGKEGKKKFAPIGHAFGLISYQNQYYLVDNELGVAKPCTPNPGDERRFLRNLGKPFTITYHKSAAGPRYSYDEYKMGDYVLYSRGRKTHDDAHYQTIQYESRRHIEIYIKPSSPLYNKRYVPTGPYKKASAATPLVSPPGPEAFERKKTKKKARLTDLSKCIRSSAAVTKLPRKFMPNAPEFDPALLTSEMSGKFSRLIQQIRELDEKDMAKHGHHFKHFIFTDIRESAFGAKALAAFLIAAGFDLRMKKQTKQVRRQGKLVDTKTGETVFVNEEKPDGFAMLQSFPMWKNPLSVNVKKDIIRTFNSRPDNVHGERLRLIVLDSKYKEGIDLFDVKYVHLMEPAIAESDLKQAVGRATRYCGQKGLAFVPNKGWPLEVFVYTTELPNRAPFSLGDGATVDAHELMLKHSGLDLALINLTKELTVLAISSAVDYDLNYKINNFSIAEEVMEIMDVDDDVVVEVSKLAGSPTSVTAVYGTPMDGGAKKEKLIEIHSVDDITPELVTKCSKYPSELFNFKGPEMIAAARSLKMKIPAGAKREWFCQRLRDTPALFELLMRKKRAESANKVVSVPVISVPESPKSASKSPGMSPLNLGTPAVRPATPGAASAETLNHENRNIFNALHEQYAEAGKLRLPGTPRAPPASPRTISAHTMTPPGKVRISESQQAALDQLRAMFPSPLEEEPLKPLSLTEAADLPFDEFQRHVIQLYEKYRWQSPIVKSGCDAVVAGKPGTAVSFTNTQDFIRHYLTPGSPFKGLLAWHSVGTGKTCMAVAAATTTFEREGYNILWVTRNALMADVWKNVFGSVCSIPIMEKLAAGTTMPESLAEQRRMLSRAWFNPISYRTFQNALEKKNEIGRMLYASQGGGTDPLRKTFLIMDEVHKLQDGDLGPAEAADFKKIQRYIHESYDKSGANSVRCLFMTATPITDTPRELFDILNTFIPAPEKRLMPFDEYRAAYADEAGHISLAGRAYFQEHCKGLISYLNREFDPTTFAQPRFHTVSVPVGSVSTPTVAELVESCAHTLEGLEIPAAQIAAEAAADVAESVESAALEDCDALEEELKRLVDTVQASDAAKKEKSAQIKTLKADYGVRIKACRKTAKAAAKDKARATKKAQKEAAKANKASRRALKLPDAVGKCFTEKKKDFTRRRKMMQIKGMEACFKEKKPRGTKKAKEPKVPGAPKAGDAYKFINRKDFLNGMIARALGQPYVPKEKKSRATKKNKAAKNKENA
jgi:hypothetical protein